MAFDLVAMTKKIWNASINSILRKKNTLHIYGMQKKRFCLNHNLHTEKKYWDETKNVS